VSSLVYDSWELGMLPLVRVPLSIWIRPPPLLGATTERHDRHW
jgi:hypothetical protein